MFLFLDVDGVLNGMEYFKSGFSHIGRKLLKRSNLNPVNLFWVGLFCRISKATVVMSSSVRYHLDRDLKPMDRGMEKLLRTLRFYGVKVQDRTSLPCERDESDFALEALLGERCSSTPCKYTRGFQIYKYLWTHPNPDHKFLILEDDVSDVECFDPLKSNIVQTSFYDRKGGFRLKHFMLSMKYLLSKEAKGSFNKIKEN